MAPSCALQPKTNVEVGAGKGPCNGEEYGSNSPTDAAGDGGGDGDGDLEECVMKELKSNIWETDEEDDTLDMVDWDSTLSFIHNSRIWSSLSSNSAGLQ